MKRIMLYTAAFMLCALPAMAADILIALSSGSSGQQEALNGFLQAWQGSTRTIKLTDYSEVDLLRLAKEEKSLMVVAIGERALKNARAVRHIPVLGLMAPSLQPSHAAIRGPGGVSYLPAPRHYLELFRKLGARRVGIVASRSWDSYLQRAAMENQQSGIELVAHKVSSSRETIKSLEQLKGKVDALWMLPDLVAITPENIEAFPLFSLQNRIPLITFSSAYLAQGASVSLEADRMEIGRQAGELAKSILQEGAETQNSVVEPRKHLLNKNTPILRQLGIKNL